jgi:diguanylate cyclase (GGDEF)-like protein
LKALFINALFMKCENEENIEKELDIIGKILSLDPGNAKAKNKLRRHLIKTGDMAYENGDFEQALEAEILKSKRYNTELSVLVIDFDNFSEVNRAYGYDSGDTILATSAALIQTMVRKTDVVCRYGGEEFGIVMSGTGLTGARMLGERIRKKLAAHEFGLDTDMVRLTVSIGIASYLPEIDHDESDIVKRAIAALTSAMNKGGNRVQTILS